MFAPAFYPLPQATLPATRCLLLSVLAMPLAGAAIDARRATHGGDGVAADVAAAAREAGRCIAGDLRVSRLEERARGRATA